MSKRKRGVVAEVGINDADYAVTLYDKETGKRIWRCPFYTKWSNMLCRCYNEKYQSMQPTYKDKSVCNEWKLFSNFKKWMSDHQWENMELDKDILIRGNKEYGPDTCAFIPRALNNLLSGNISYSDKLPLGVTLSSSSSRKLKPFRMQAQVFDTGRKKSTWCTTAEGAHKAWQLEKAVQIESAVHWYATQPCFRTDVAEALITRVWQLRLDYSMGVETIEL